jgi:hypothetical protein
MENAYSPEELNSPEKKDPVASRIIDRALKMVTNDIESKDNKLSPKDKNRIVEKIKGILADPQFVTPEMILGWREEIRSLDNRNPDEDKTSAEDIEEQLAKGLAIRLMDPPNKKAF